MKRVKITIEGKEIVAELNNTKTAEAIWGSLPIKGIAYKWGDEFYFYTKTKCSPENPREEVEIGDLGYWLEGSAFCIFFGKTPVSTSNKPRAASPVNVFGRVVHGIEKLREMKTRAGVTVEKMN